MLDTKNEKMSLDCFLLVVKAHLFHVNHKSRKGLFLFAGNLIIICIQGANRDNSHCPFFWTPTAL